MTSSNSILHQDCYGIAVPAKKYLRNVIARAMQISLIYKYRTYTFQFPILAPDELYPRIRRENHNGKSAGAANDIRETLSLAQ
jgi:hypothetical protein